ncbi:MAG: hypothetical protein QXZ70_04745 [Candidatus Bathyarchaeia archaeon]
MKSILNKIAILLMLTLGISLTLLSAVFSSSLLAILGTAIAFWCAILLYITPTKHVPLTLLNATADAANIERILSEHNITQKGIYLPPKNLADIESSLIFIPEKPGQSLPSREESTIQKLKARSQEGIFITPPGFALSKLFEKEIGTDFIKIDLKKLQEKLSWLLVENMGLAENVEFQIGSNKITIHITNNVFIGICQQTRKLPLTHVAVGCLLTSAIACALAKTTGKPIIIAEEKQDQKTTIIEYHLLEN